MVSAECKHSKVLFIKLELTFVIMLVEGHPGTFCKKKLLYIDSVM